MTDDKPFSAHGHHGFKIVGHRGAMAIEPENTMRSFARAAELGVDAIELDVHLSRDGRLVIMHDELVDRTTDGTGAIADLDWAELRALDAGLGERVPELTEVWAEFDDVGLQIEVKSAAATTAVLELVRSGRPRALPTTITSFHPEVVAEASRQPRPWRVGLIFGKNEEAKLVEHVRDDVDQLMLHWELSGSNPAQGLPRGRRDRQRVDLADAGGRVARDGRRLGRDHRRRRRDGPGRTRGLRPGCVGAALNGRRWGVDRCVRRQPRGLAWCAGYTRVIHPAAVRLGGPWPGYS